MTDAMSTTIPTRGRAVRARKIERPRPLKLVIDSNTSRYPDLPNFRNISSPVNIPTGDYNIQTSPLNSRPIYDILQSMELIVQHVKNCNYDNVLAAMITKICNQLKSRGLQLESMHKDLLDKCFVALRNASKHPKLDFMCRIRLLEVIELRAMGWRPNENLINYYKRKCQEVESGDSNGIRDSMISLSPCSTPSYTPNITPCATPTSTPSTPMFPNQPSFPAGPVELVRSSGKYVRPTKIPNKNYFRDEIIIRNSDSGKVMGIKGRRVHMIEELSETVISFQRANQGARDRLVQITGQNEEAISRARQLIEDTIRRNASPIRTEKPDRRSIGSNFSESSFSMSSGDASDLDRSSWDNMGVNSELSQYECTAHLGKEGVLKLQGNNLDVLKKAKHILEEQFASSNEKKILERATVSSSAIHSRPKQVLEKSSSEDSYRSPFIIRLSSVQSESSAETPISSPRRFSYSLDSGTSFEFDPAALSSVEPASDTHWRLGQNHSIVSGHLEVAAEKSKSFEGRLNSTSHILEKAVKVEPFYPASSIMITGTVTNVTATTTNSHCSLASTTSCINFIPNVDDKSNNNVNSEMPSLTLLAQQAVQNLDDCELNSNQSRKGSSSGSDTTLSEDTDSTSSEPTLALELNNKVDDDVSDQCQVAVVRQPLFPDSSKEAINQAECSTDLSTLSAKARRAQFAKTSETFKEKNGKMESKTENSSSGSDDCATPLTSMEPKWIIYSRDFLLDCAKSPFCRVTPRELPRLSRELPIILRKVPDIFDPVAYRQRLSTSNVIYKNREPLEHTLNLCSLTDKIEAGDMQPYHNNL